MDLVARGLFHHGSSNSDSSNHTCPAQNINDPPQVPFVADISFQKFTEYLSGACLGVSCLLTFFLIMRHAMNYSMPHEQRQIIRIIFTIPVFSLVSFLCICFQSAAIYITPIGDLYESFSLAAFFMLLCTFVREEKAASTLGTRKTALQVFQFPAVMFLVFLIQEISEAKGTYCDTEVKVYFAKLWCTILRIGSTTIAIMSLLRFYKQSKPIIAHRKPLPKFIAFKGIVFLNFVQTTIFSFLTPHLKPTNKLTTLDLTIGIPHLIVALEMVLFALAFLKFYSAGEYVSSSAHYYGGFLGMKALFASANIFGFIGDMVKEVMGRVGTGEAPPRYESVGLTARHSDDHV